MIPHRIARCKGCLHEDEGVECEFCRGCEIMIGGGMSHFRPKQIDATTIIYPQMPDKILFEVQAEINRANSIHPAMFNSSNEAAGVVREEYLELEHELFHGDPERAREEAIQVAAVAIKTVIYLDKKMGRNAQ